MKAIRSNNSSEIKKLVAEAKKQHCLTELLSYQDKMCTSWLCYAVLYSNAGTVRTITKCMSALRKEQKQIPNLNMQAIHRDALLKAVRLGDKDKVAVLLDAGLVANKRSIYHWLKEKMLRL
jgi:hypothetical protein